jgi:2-hydroxy-3-keto-5-methylthiopentenyl-1-phosphate phosphatase
MPNIAIVWDFDGTLSPDDSTTKTVEVLQGPGKGGNFWKYIKALRGDKDKSQPKWEHVLAMDAPIWMYSLGRLATTLKVPLNAEFFKKFVLPHIKLYPNVIGFLQAIKEIEDTDSFKKMDLKVHHFIISAGLKELIEQVFPDGLITWTFGCRYTVVAHPDHMDEPESIPVFCMDETVKTRSLFEISKGAFDNEKIKVNTRVAKEKLWAPFENMIYVGDGDTDVPALSLTRSKGGIGIAVYDPEKTEDYIQGRFKNMRLDKRADLITEANFAAGSELYDYIYSRCVQIRQRYEAAEILSF